MGDATDALAKLGFKVKRASEDVFSETVKAGDVVGISLPEASKQIWKSTVTLTISKGPERVEMPNVIGLDAGEACKKGGILDNNRLKCATPYSGPQITGQISKADHEVGDLLKPGTEIQLTID